MNSTKTKVNKIIKSLILVIAAMGLVLSGISYGYDDYVELTPVPEEMIKEIAMKDPSTKTYINTVIGEKNIVDCELVPGYSLNGDIWGYFTILFFEGTPKQSWEEIIERLSPDYEGYKELEERIKALEMESFNLEKELEKTENEIERERILTQIKELDEQIISLNKDFIFKTKSDYEGRDDYYFAKCGANFEQSPKKEIGCAGLPRHIYRYWHVVDFLKDEFETDDIEFINFVTDGRGWYYEFLINGKRIITAESPYRGNWWDYRENVEDNIDFNKLYKDCDESNVDEWYEILELNGDDDED